MTQSNLNYINPNRTLPSCGSGQSLDPTHLKFALENLTQT